MKRRRGRATASSRRASQAGLAPPSSWIAGRPVVQQILVALALLAIALVCLIPEITLQGRVFGSPDYKPPSDFAVAGRAALETGSYPLWNPFVFLGMPSFGSLAFTPYVYPISELLGAWGRLPFVPPLGWLLFYYMAAGFGTFLLLRRLHCVFWAALVGGTVFMLMPHLVSMGVYGHGSKLASVSYLPYLLLVGIELRTAGRRRLWTALLGLLLGFQLLRGHPQIAFYGLLMLALLGLVELVAVLARRVRPGEFLRFASGLGGGVVLGFGISAVLLYPVHEYAPHSIRGASVGGGAAYEYATHWSLGLVEMVTFWVPSAFGYGDGTYVGQMPFTDFPHYLGQASLLFGAAALVLLRGRLLVFLVSLVGLALLVSFGRHFPLVYDFFFDHLPYFNKFRVPVMILVLLQLGASILVGLGLTAFWGRLPRDLAWRHEPKPRLMLRVFGASAVVAVFLWIAAWPWSGALQERVAQSPRLPVEARAHYAGIASRMLQEDAVRVGVLLLAHAAVVVLLWRRRLGADAAGLVLLVLASLDLIVVDRRMVTPQKTWAGASSPVVRAEERTPAPTPLVQWLEKKGQDEVAPLRILPLGEFWTRNSWMRSGLSSPGGYHPAKLARYQAFLEVLLPGFDSRLVDLLAVRYLVAPTDLLPNLEPVYSGEDGVVYAYTRARERVWVTGRVQVVSQADCMDVLRDPEWGSNRPVLIETQSEIELDSLATGSARVVSFAANGVTLEVETTGPALVVLAEAHHPGWRARVNGVPQEVLPAECILRAVAVPAGRSRVELEFQSPALRAGFTLTLVSLAVTLGLATSTIVRRRRRGGVPEIREPQKETP